MECIVRFEVMHGEAAKDLRGLIILGKDERPTEDQFLKMFARMGYNVRLDDAEQLLFKPVDPSSEIRWLRIRELDSGEEKTTEDRDLKSIIGNLLPNQNRPI
ncbi:hypothetical protein QWJ34_16950 [Saccharibacillus sp. CPCC 101409]|uniref:hypothetical protein n=1 Tax=Saccharibacillus sp. CPCC 101409 TaxID=3058041 RepID=UPI002673DE92|nr:hypothetical protein [Saccharibacillus sp. CPCC 101409]MDO3411457.1 hypothetical protein [Saccharibacillus sp. CPCC 101409]